MNYLNVLPAVYRIFGVTGGTRVTDYAVTQKTLLFLLLCMRNMFPICCPEYAGIRRLCPVLPLFYGRRRYCE